MPTEAAWIPAIRERHLLPGKGKRVEYVQLIVVSNPVQATNVVNVQWKPWLWVQRACWLTAVVV